MKGVLGRSAWVVAKRTVDVSSPLFSRYSEIGIGTVLSEAQLSYG